MPNTGCKKEPVQPSKSGSTGGLAGTGGPSGTKNQSPIADAGADTTIILPSNTIILDGTASYDPDNNISSCQWTKISGPASFNISNASAVQTQVSNLVAGDYLFELKVTDTGGLIAKDTMKATVSQQSVDPDVNIYVAGFEYNGSHRVAKYWKNGQPVSLTDGSREACANSIVVVGSDVYVAGFECDGDSVPSYDDNGNYLGIGGYVMVAKYWKNGNPVSLSDGTTLANAGSIVVVGSDVYVSGSEFIGSSWVVKYWKNGHPVSLSDGTKNTHSGSIAVVGSDIYVTGTEYNANGSIGIAKYWKNGQPVSLTDGTKSASAGSIVLVGNDVYVAGGKYNGTHYVAQYWKNGQPISITDGTTNAVVNSIAVVGSDVYATGREGNVAKYWKNGEPRSLTTGSYNTFGSSIVVVRNIVYVAGTEANIVKYWKNGQAVALTNGSREAFGYSIAVVPH